MARCLHVNKTTGELLLHVVYFSKYQILQGPSFCFLCHLIFLLLIFTPPGCGPTVVWRESIVWWPVHSSSSLTPSICSLVLWILSLKEELPSVDCVWHGGLWLYSRRIRLRGCCQPVCPQPCAPWMPFMDGSWATIPCWTQFESTGYPACMGQSLFRAVETGVKLILALRSAPNLFRLLQQCGGSCCVSDVLCRCEASQAWEGPQAFLNSMVCCYLLLALWKPWLPEVEENVWSPQFGSLSNRPV